MYQMDKIFTSSDLNILKVRAEHHHGEPDNEAVLRALLLEVIASHQAMLTLGWHTHEDLGRVKQ